MNRETREQFNKRMAEDALLDAKILLTMLAFVALFAGLLAAIHSLFAN